MSHYGLTAEQFLDQRLDLPEAGQWTELIRGVPVSLQPPDLDHGTVILNLSRFLSEHAHASPDFPGYACFDLGLVVERRPDTIFFPAVCYFIGGQRFAEADHEATATVPTVVMELLSTSDRRAAIHDKTSAYLRHGVQGLWQIDPQQRVVYITNTQGHTRRLTDLEHASQPELLPGFNIPVKGLFEEPKWAK